MLRWLGKWTIRRRLMFLMMVSSCATLAVVSVAWLTYDRYTTRDAMLYELSIMGEIVSNAAGSALTRGTPQDVEDSLLVFSQRPGVLRSAVYGRDGEVLVSYSGYGADPGLLPLSQRSEVLGDDRLAVYVPIVRNEERVGTIGIESSLEGMRRRQFGFGGVLLVVLLIGLALAFGLALKLQELVSGPIVLLTGTMRAVSEHKDYGLRARKMADDEVGYLTDAFNEMLVTIGERDLELERHRNSLEDDVEQRTRELRAKNDQLQVSMEKARAAAVAKSQFLANMSHEIRTPLNGILGLNAMMLDSELSEEQRGQVELVGSSAQALLAILNDILDFSKIEAGKLDLEHIPIDLFRVVEEVMRILSGSVHEKGLQMTCWIDPDLPSELLGDPTRIRQVLTNLMGNAVKFTSEGQISVRVERLESMTDEVPVKISVTDTGIGIEPGECDRLFESFSQADTSTTRRYGGTGLGLAICQQLVEMMGGKIGVDSEHGVGSTFWFMVPFQCDAESTTRPVGGLELGQAPVLVADPSVAVREAIRQQLLAWGVPCEAVTGLEAIQGGLAVAREEGRPFGVLLVGEELVSPGLVETLEPRRASDPLRVVGMSWAGTARRAATEGFEPDAHLEKPIRPSELLNSLQALQELDPPILESSPVPEAAPAPPSGLEEPRAALPTPRGTADPGLPVEPGEDPDPASEPAPEGQLRILLAEDNRVNQIVAQRILEKGGFTCVTAADGDEALRLSGEQDFDVILMDCQMPEMDGFEATRRIRERERRRASGHRTFILALTANALAQDRQRCLDSGMDDYLSKPVAQEDLLEKLARQLRAGGVAHGAPGTPGGLDGAA